MPDLKTCTFCLLPKLLSEFHIRRASPDGLNQKCKPCQNKYAKKYYKGYKPQPKEYKYIDSQSVKICACCKLELGVDQFYKRAASKDGLMCYCKSCSKSKAKKYKSKAKAKQSDTKHKIKTVLTEEQKKERKRQNDQQYREKNRDRLRQKARERYQVKKEEIKEYQAKYKWHKINPEASRASVQKRRAIRNKAVTEDVSRQDIIDRDYSLCYLCGNSFDNSEIAIDHIEPLSMGGSHTYDNLTVTCRPCNSSKGNKTLLEYLLYVSNNK